MRSPHPHAVAFVFALGAPACTGNAPPEQNELTHTLYREWGATDPAAMQRALLQLEALLAGRRLGPDGQGDDRKLRVDPLRRDDVTVAPWPMDRDPTKCLGTAVARESAWPVEDHARVQADPDQAAVEPTATTYVRTFLEPTDPSCFPTRACAALRTSNDIVRSNPSLEVQYVLDKDLRWFDLGDGRAAMVGRSWSPASARGSGGAILQSYSLDVWLPRPEARTWRYQALFSENELKIPSTDEVQVQVVTGTLDDAMKLVDRVIASRYHAP